MESTWIFYGFGAALCVTGLVLVFKKLLLMGINPLILNLFLFAFVFLGFSIWTFATKTPIQVSKIMILLLALAAIFSMLGTFFDVMSVKNAPNPGYASTLKATQVVFITILATFLFKSEFNSTKFIGILLVLAGVFLVTR